MSAIRLIPPTEGGKPVELNDIVEYLTLKNYASDLPALRRAVETAQTEETELLLTTQPRYPERECYKLIKCRLMQSFMRLPWAARI